MLVNKMTRVFDLEDIKLGDKIEDGMGIKGQVLRITIDRYLGATHYYFTLHKGAGTLLVIK